MASELEVTVLYFAAASTATQRTEERVRLPIASDTPSKTFPLASLSAVLAARYPGTGLDKVLERSAWSVNAEMVDDAKAVMLKGGEEVAVICPVSGG
jgi:molybdopterin converting factor small subunit